MIAQYFLHVLGLPPYGSKGHSSPQEPYRPIPLTWLPSPSTNVEHHGSAKSADIRQPWKIWLPIVNGNMQAFVKFVATSVTRQTRSSKSNEIQ